MKNDVIHYEKSTFTDEYKIHLTEVLNNINEKGNVDRKKITVFPYVDPDSVNKNGIFNNQDFYQKLFEFLKEQNKKVLDKKLDFRKDEKYLTEESNEKMYLTSDQFGFSAPRYEFYKKIALDGGDESKYPYIKYIYCFENDKSEAIDKVVECVYNTRTIGGSFIWPKVYVETKKGKVLKSIYNENRGAKVFIEDTVDLTLLEIKHFYDCVDKNGKFDEKKYNDLFIKDLLLRSKYDRDEIIRWLLNFKSFKGYVDFFKFSDFVHFDGNKFLGIVDIVLSTINDEKDDIKYLDLDKAKKSFRIKKITNKDDLERLITNISLLILRRSFQIENIKN